MSGRPCIIQLCCMHFSGSSILNVLLNAQPGIRGMGELYHVYEGQKQCFCSCGKRLPECDFYGPMSVEGVYATCREAYGCEAIVDSSKNSMRMESRVPDGWDSVAVILSKEPHAWLHSHVSHVLDNTRPPVELLSYFIHTYRRALDLYREKGREVIAVTYRELATDPAAVVRRICERTTGAFDPAAMERWWETDTHIAGGNAAVFHQVRSTERYFRTISKYQDRMHRVFLDESWMQDQEFIRECLEAYAKIGLSYADDVLNRIGQRDLAAQRRGLELLLPVAA